MKLANPTNARAYVRLQPTQNNIGGIVEEHIRFWKKYDDEQDARRKEREAREAEVQRKLNDDFLSLTNFRPEENAGYFNEQIISNYEAMRPEITKLAKDYKFNGNLSSGLKLQEIRKKIEQAVKMNKSFGQQVSKLNKQKSEGTYNQDLDENVERMLESVSKGLWKLDKDFNFSLYDPNSKDVKTLSPSQMFSEPFMNWNYSKNPNINSLAKGFALNMLDTKDGNRSFDITDKNTRRKRGVSMFSGAMSSDSLLSRTIMAQYNKSQTDPNKVINKTYGQLSDLEKVIVNGYAYDRYLEPLILQNTNSIRDKQNELIDAKIKTEKSKQFKNYQAGKKEEKVYPTIEVATSETGESVTEPSAGTVYKGTIPNKNLNYGSTTNSKGNRITGFEVLENGGIAFTGFELNGDKENPLPTNKRVRIDEISSVNEIIRQIPNGKSKNETFKNAKEFLDEFQSKLGGSVDFSRKQTPRKKALGDSIFE